MKKTVSVVIVAVLLATALISFTGCNSNVKRLLDGRWQLTSSGDSRQENMAEPSLPVYVDIYPDGRVTMYTSYIGKYKISRNRFEFASDDGKYSYSGSFVLEYPDLYLYLDDEDSCHYFQKSYNHKADGSLDDGTSTR